MPLEDQIQRLCDRQDKLERQYLAAYYSMDVNKPAVYCRYRGATQREIADAEKGWKQSYPPSYVAFLKQQNGWLRFGAGWTLVGAPRAENKRHYHEIKKTLAQVDVVATPQERAELSEAQKKDAKMILPTDHLPFGTDQNYGLLVFDRYRVSRAGEPEVVSVRHGIHVAARWKTLKDFIQFVIEDTEKGLSKVNWEVPAIGTEAPVKKARKKTTRR